MTERVPTERELQLVMNVCNKFEEHVVIEDGDLIWMGSGLFDPLHNSNDLDVLIRAMQAAEYQIDRTHHAVTGSTTTKIRTALSATPPLVTMLGTTDRYATTFAIIDALAAEAERKEENRDA
ncbi:MAG: hypothetical protein O7D91_17690 [Planctomycetota bacterium]|nr:hypothetical protein [Planctomycetota bacterium]